MRTRVLTTVAFSLAVLGLFHASWTAAQPGALDVLRGQWRAGQYAFVIEPLLTYRETVTFGRDAEVDYMLATSCCRLERLKGDGRQFFAWVLAAYSLSPEQRRVVTTERAQCGDGAPPAQVAFVTDRAGSGNVGVRGKTFIRLGPENSLLTSDPVRVLRDVPRQVFLQRLSPLEGDGAAALARARDVAGPSSRGARSDRFLVLSPSGRHTEAGLLTAGRGLDDVSRFFQTEYRASLPSRFLTAYLVNTEGEVQSLADRVHGLRVPNTTIGYSYRDDLSLVALVPPGTEAGPHGTLKHELLHLVVRTNFGDIPAWLDEGLAALYEVSAWRRDTSGRDRLVGLENWRRPILEQSWDRRPTVEALLRMNWEAFDNVERAGLAEDPRNQAAKHAMARYFVLFLERRQKLREVYDALRARDPRAVTTDPGTDTVQRVEAALGTKAAQIDADFQAWFRAGAP